MNANHWQAWHLDYDDPASSLAQRLIAVRERIGIALDEAPAGPLTIVSMVAGQARDLIPVLATHPRRDDVKARLVELDPNLADQARAAAADAGLTGVDMLTGDAALIEHYRDYVPADVVLICGLFGNIGEADIVRTIRHAASLTERGGVLIWTRHRRDNMFPQISAWFDGEGFEPVWESDSALPYGIGVHRATRVPPPIVAGTKLFTFASR